MERTVGEPALDAAEVALRERISEWARGDDDAVEVSFAEAPDEGLRRVIVRRGERALEVWLDGARSLGEVGVDVYWRVAEVLGVAERGGLDRLERGEQWSLWGFADHALVCREPDGECFRMPSEPAPVELRCSRSCTLTTRGAEGRMAHWALTSNARGVRRRMERSWPEVPEALEGPWDAGARRERGRWENLERVETRPAIAGEPALASGDPYEGECQPTIRSIRRGDDVVRVASCGPGDPDDGPRGPVALSVARGDAAYQTPVFMAEIAAPEPLRFVDVAPMAPGAIGFEVEVDDGGSPSGGSTHALWIFVPPTEHGGPRLHALELGGSRSEGLGTEDEAEGYEVAVTRSRTTFVPEREGLGRFTACERWSGTHARRSGRWRGERTVTTLSIAVRFDRATGFAIDEADEELLAARCGTSLLF